jgi:putative photosynthetic complex assembly protein 2
MEAHGFPALFALLLWWGSTGLVLMLVRRPAQAHPRILLGATVALAVGLFGLVATAHETGLVAVYLSFTAGLLVWAWPEIAFLLGYVTGPNQAPSPVGARGWLRFRLAAGTLIWHEIAILGFGMLVVALTWNAPNQVGTLTFLMLWALRLSAKLNLYLGARNPGAELLPPKLAHLGSHFRTASMNALFPVSVCVAIAGAAWFGWAALTADSVAEAAGQTFLATLLALAALEHVLLMLPIPASTMFAAWLGAPRPNGAPKNPAKSPNGTDLGRAELRSLARTEAT